MDEVFPQRRRHRRTSQITRDDCYISGMTAKPDPRFGPARVFRLGEEPRDDLAATTTAEQRLDIVALLSARMRELDGSASEALRRDCIVIRSLTDA
jgi:hypothetical protein